MRPQVRAGDHQGGMEGFLSFALPGPGNTGRQQCQPRNTGFCLKNYRPSCLNLRRRFRVKLAPGSRVPPPAVVPGTGCGEVKFNAPSSGGVGDGLARPDPRRPGTDREVGNGPSRPRPCPRSSGVDGSFGQGPGTDGIPPARRARGPEPHRVGAYAGPLLVHAVRLLHGLAARHDPAPGGPPPRRPRGPGVRAAAPRPRRAGG